MTTYGLSPLVGLRQDNDDTTTEPETDSSAAQEQDQNDSSNTAPLQGFSLPPSLDELPSNDPVANKIKEARDNLLYAVVAAEQVGPTGRLRSLVKSLETRLDQITDPTTGWAHPDRKAERLQELEQISSDARLLARSIRVSGNGLILNVSGSMPTIEWFFQRGLMSSFTHIAFDDTDLSDEIFEALIPAKDLLSLRITGGSRLVTGSGLSRLSAYKLERLNLARTDANDDALVDLANFPKLNELFLNETQVTGEVLSHIVGLKSLTRLDLNRTQVGDSGFDSIAELPNLEFVGLSDTQITGESLRHIAGHSKLTRLDLARTQIDDESLIHLTKLKNLLFLDLQETPLTGVGFESLGPLDKLIMLNLGQTNVGDSGIRALGNLPDLTRIELSSTRVTDATVAHLAESDKLQYVDLYGTHITDSSLEHLRNQREIRKLFLGGTQITDDGLQHLARLKGITELDLRGTQITDEGLRHLAGLWSLNVLRLSGTQVTGSGLHHLAKLDQLNILDLADTPLHDDGLESIARLPALRVLDLGGTEVTDAGTVHLATNEQLRVISLESTSTGEGTLQVLKQLPYLRVLDLDSTRIDDESIGILKDYPSLAELSLNHTSISDSGVKQLGNSFVRLEFGSTTFSDQGIRNLQANAQLQSLNLSGTPTTDEGIQLLQAFPDIRTLNIARTNISDSSTSQLVEFQNLDHLDLSGTAVSDLAVESLRDMNHLESLNLEGTRVTTHGSSLLKRELPDLAVQHDQPWEWDQHWTFFNDDATSNIGTPESNSTMVHELEGLTFLHVDDQMLSLKLLQALKQVPTLERLSFSGSRLGDPELAELVGLSQVTSLDLSSTSVTDSGLQYLKAYHSLRDLNLRGTSIQGDGFIHLQHLQHLQSLHLGNTNIDDSDIRLLANMPNLRRLDLASTRITDATIGELALLPNLNYLDLYGTELSDQGMVDLARMQGLRFCYLSQTKIGDDGVKRLSALVDLEELGLDGTQVTDDALETISKLHHLRRLRISNTDISVSGLVSFSPPPHLNALEVADLPIGDQTLAQLDFAPQLISLNLAGTQVSDASLETISNWSQLRELDIRDTDITNAAISQFVSDRPDVQLKTGQTRNPPHVGSVILLVLYAIVVLSICFYGTHRLMLILAFLRSRRIRQRPELTSPLSNLPDVTVQLPMFNEARVARRVIEAACALEYPREHLQIQVLDDSTGSDAELVRSICDEYRAKGHEIVLLHRDHRDGFKGGALREGLKSARGDFVAIFDADFVPPSDFLDRVLPYFGDEEIGLIQTEWSYLNRDESWLTQCQAIFLDGHFVVEQSVRSHRGRWFNFNGTAGVWRKACIEEAGGWSHDTLTEDTDLSYRSQLAGWRFLYLPHVKCDSEIPSTMSAFLGQQHRWSKGLIQSAKKLLPRILQSRAPLATRFEAWCHLTAPLMYVVMFVLTLIALPALYVSTPLNEWSGLALALGVASLCLGTLSTTLYYVLSQRAQGIGLWTTLIRLPLLMGLGIGMSVVNTQAVVTALVGWRSPFVRTPKFGGRADYARTTANERRRRIPRGWMELVLAGVLSACLILAFLRPFTLIGAPFLLLFAAGYLMVGTALLVDSRRSAALRNANREEKQSLAALTRMQTSPVVAGSFALAVVAVVALVGVVYGVSRQTRAQQLPIAESTFGVDLTHAKWQTGGDAAHAPQRAVREVIFDRDTLKLLVELDENRDQGEVYLNLTGSLQSLGKSLDSSRAVSFELEYPERFTGEFQAFVRDLNGRSEYGSMEFIESHDHRKRVVVTISPSRWMPAMGYQDEGFDASRGMSQIGLKIAAQSDRVRGEGYRGFRGVVTVSNVRIKDIGSATNQEPEILKIEQPVSTPSASTELDTFVANSGLVRPWPLGYAFSGPLNDEKQQILNQTFQAIQESGLSYARIYLGDYRTGLILDSGGMIIDVEEDFANYVQRVVDTANRYEVTPLICLTDNTMADGRGIEYTDFITEGEQSDRFVERVLMRFIRDNRDRNVIWDIFNEPENVTEISLREIQRFVDRVLAAGRSSHPDARFTVVSRGREDLVFWRGRGLDLYAHNVFNSRGLEESIDSTIELDAPIIVAEIDPELVTVDHIASLHDAGYESVGIWGWETNDKYDWKASEIDERIAPLLQSKN